MDDLFGPAPDQPTPRERARLTRQQRDHAIAVVLGNERERWKLLHDRELMQFLIERGAAGRSFLGEDFRVWFLSRGHREPHHPNVWGAMWMAAAKRGVIAKTGQFANTADGPSHASATALWMKSTEGEK